VVSRRRVRDAARDAVRDAAPTRSNDDFDLDDDD
jgi:hypothetical protein